MTNLAIIGGTGLNQIDGFSLIEKKQFNTPFGATSSPVFIGELAGQAVMFLPRHGEGHRVPPHKINYRANIWALDYLGADSIIAVAAVGGIRSDMTPSKIAIPDQIIDYTYGREQSFFSDHFCSDNHIDFSYPYDQTLREQLLAKAQGLSIDVIDGGTYGATQGPRLETAAEIKRMAQDGCAMVGMTGMPEAALARELKLSYACCAVMANWAAGLSDGVITMTDIEQNLEQGMSDVRQLIQALIQS